MTLKNFYTANIAKSGDVFACIITCQISPMGYRLYRCQYPDTQLNDGIPQGMRLDDKQGEIAANLFPIVRNSGVEEDRF